MKTYTIAYGHTESERLILHLGNVSLAMATETAKDLSKSAAWVRLKDDRDNHIYSFDKEA